MDMSFALEGFTANSIDARVPADLLENTLNLGGIGGITAVELIAPAADGVDALVRLSLCAEAMEAIGGLNERVVDNALTNFAAVAFIGDDAATQLFHHVAAASMSGVQVEVRAVREDGEKARGIYAYQPVGNEMSAMMFQLIWEMEGIQTGEATATDEEGNTTDLIYAFWPAA